MELMLNSFGLYLQLIELKLVTYFLFPQRLMNHLALASVKTFTLLPMTDMWLIEVVCEHHLLLSHCMPSTNLILI